jgi:glycosyltransferase involved in cell wall biosynthesis
MKALKILNDSSIQLTIVGKNDNSYGVSLQKLSKNLQLQNQISFVGKQIDVRPYIADSDLYIIPTLDEGRKEGMPMALVEAMSMGIPILGSNITGIKFVLKQFPDLLFKASDPYALATHIKQIQSLSFEERLDIGDSLRNYCLTHFAMHHFIDAHQKLYSQLVKGKK